MKETKKFLVTIIGILLIVLGLSSMALYLNVKAEDTSGQITLSKTAEKTTNRKAKVTLEIQTSRMEQPTTDIVIVMDRSGSMYDTICTKYSERNQNRCIESKRKLTVAKEQAVELVKKVLPANNVGNVKVGIVTFGTYYESRYSTQSYDQMSSNQNTVIQRINNIQVTSDNGTNVQAGLNAAKNLLSSSQANNKIVILISDGEPTYYNVGNNLCGNGQTDSKDSSYGCNGLKPSEAAEAVANTIKANPIAATIYAIGFGDKAGNIESFLTNKIATPATADTKYAYSASETADLENAMSAIASNIKHILATNATVTDIIPNSFSLTEETITALQTTYGDKIIITQNADGTTTLQVKYPEISSIDGTYKIEYEIKAKDEYNGAMYTNDSATFTATATEDNTFYDNKNISMVFDKPVVAIEAVTKDDDLTNINMLEGQTYTLDKDTILSNDIINQQLHKVVIQALPNPTIPNSTIANTIVIDKVSCGTAKVNDNGDIEYTPSEGCEGNPTIQYHLVSDITIYQYNGTGLEKVNQKLTSIAAKYDKNGNVSYETSSTITLAVERVPVTYTVKYLEKDTNKELVNSKTVSGYKNRDQVTETALLGYEDEPNGVEILREYDLVGNKTQTITLTKENNVIIFYYIKKNVEISEPILQKESSNTNITSLKNPIKYTIGYYTEVEDFKGELTITLIDTLPHRIVTSESNYACPSNVEYSCNAKYDSKKETITYTIKYNVNTFETGTKKIIRFSIPVSLKYDETDFDGSETSIINRVETNLVAGGSKIPSADDKEIPANIEGTVNAHYVYLDSNNEEQPIADGKYDTSHTAAIGREYHTTKKEIPGYTFKEVRGNETGKFKEGTITVTYIYTKDPVEVIENPTVVKKVQSGTVINSTKQEITYYVDYKTTVKNHDGDVTLKVIDTLEYPIESVKVNSSGWTATYDGNNTITFIKNYHIHTSITENNTVEIEESLSYTIKLKTFAVHEDQDNYFTNKAKGVITIDTTTEGEKTKEDVPVEVKGNVIVHHLEQGTNKILKTAEYLYNENVKVGTSYTTSPASIGGYNLVSNSGNTTGIVKEKLTEVIYYYERTTATPQNPVLTKTGTTSITKVDEIVKYDLYYEAQFENYFGKLKITMIDHLPYKIDLSNSKINGNYVYDEENLTLTWIIYDEVILEEHAVDNLLVKFEEDIELSYIGIPATGTSFTNRVEIIIEDNSGIKPPQTEDHTTNIDVKGKVVTRHLEKDTNKEIVSKVETEGKVGTNYTTSSTEIPGYTLSSDSGNTTGNYIDGIINVTYYYVKKPIVITDQKIEKKSTTELIDSKEHNVDYQINYDGYVDYRGNITVIIVDQLEYPIDVSKSQLSGGTYDKDKLTITWTEKIDNLNTYLTGSKHHVSIQKIISLRYKEVPSNGTVTNKVTAYIKTEEGNTNDTDPSVVIIPSDIKGNLIVEYIYVAEDGTIKELHSYKKEEYVGTSYTTEAKRFNSYTLTSTPDNANGTIVEGTTRVTYFYSKTPAEIKDNEVDKESKKDVVTNKDNVFNYTIKYNTEIKEYIGKATITITDELKHPIDVSKSDIANGIYNKENLTITWTKEYDVNTYENKNDKININIEISLYYTNLKSSDREVENNVKTKLVIDTIKEPIINTDKEITKLEVPGKVISHYVDEFGNTISKSETYKGLVGDTYTTESKEIEGYILSSIKGNATGTYTEKDIIVTYVYEKEGTGTVEPPKSDEEPILPPNTNATINLTILSTILLSIIGLTISIKKVIKL